MKSRFFVCSKWENRYNRDNISYFYPMEYSKESQDRMQKIEALKNAGVVVYANNYHGKMDICDIEARKSEAKEVETLMAGENN